MASRMASSMTRLPEGWRGGGKAARAAWSERPCQPAPGARADTQSLIVDFAIRNLGSAMLEAAVCQEGELG